MNLHRRDVPPRDSWWATPSAQGNRVSFDALVLQRRPEMQSATLHDVSFDPAIDATKALNLRFRREKHAQ